MMGRKLNMPSFIGLAVLLLVLCLAASLWLALPGPAFAQALTGPAVGVKAILPQDTGNEACLSCHSNPGQTAPMPNGQNLSISIDPKAYSASVHGGNGMKCTVCHTDISGFPHPDKTAQGLREYAIQMGPSCKGCHADKYELTKDSVHQKQLDAGNQNAPVCSDCHNPHTQGRVLDDKCKVLIAEHAQSAQTCARCHNAIYTNYKDSVHGSALVGDGNPDVPACIDCHGVHKINDPTTNTFRLDSPQLCAGCHTNKTLMDKYGISTQVLNTYVADFHGTTVTLFQKLSPGQQTNKPVCFDCHGVHDISKTDDPQKGLKIKQNIVISCQKCHPDANTNFPDSWLSHYIPTPQRSPLVFYVQLFYNILIPLVIGSMLVYVISDFVRRMINKRKGAAHS
jgi:predicted CXXCH cytochrome family protein